MLKSVDSAYRWCLGRSHWNNQRHGKQGMWAHIARSRDDRGCTHRHSSVDVLKSDVILDDIMLMRHISFPPGSPREFPVSYGQIWVKFLAQNGVQPGFEWKCEEVGDFRTSSGRVKILTLKIERGHPEISENNPRMSKPG